MTCRLSAPATLARSRSLADQVTSGDALAVAQRIERALGDSFTTADVLGRGVAIARALADSGTLVDVLGNTLTGGGGDPPPATTITLQPLRLASGNASTLMSSGIPLQVGQLTPGAIAGVGLWRNGVEVACYLEVLEGRYWDGSVVSILLQYQTPETLQKDDTATGASPNAASYELRLSGSAVARNAKQTSWVKDVPDGAWRLPPAHYKQPVVGMWSPLTPIAEVPAGSLWKAVDTRYLAAADLRWNNGEQVTGSETALTPNVEAYNSKYDQPKTRLQYWARGGPCRMLERGLRQAAVNRNYLGGSGNLQWEHQCVLSPSMAYWLTGVATYRSCYNRPATAFWFSAFEAPESSGTTWWANDGGRPAGRRMGGALATYLLGFTNTWVYSFTSATAADSLATFNRSRQSLSGTDPQGMSKFGCRDEYDGSAENSGVSENYQSNFMAAIRAYYADLYRVYRGPTQVTTQAQYILDSATYMRSQWNQANRTYHYWNNWAAGDDPSNGVTLFNMRELALMCATQELLAYGITGGATPLDHVQDVLTMYAQEGVAASGGPGGGLKQFTENHYMYQFVMARSGTVGVV